MTKQRSMESGATTSTGLLSRTVATVTIAKHACTGAHAGETSGAIGTVATVCGSGVPEGCHVVAHVRVCCGLRAIGDQRPNVAGKRAVRHVVYDTNYWKSFVRLAVSLGDRGCLSLFAEMQRRRKT
jgi:hypothetical protein